MATALASPPASEEWRTWPIEAKRRLVLRLRETLHGSWRERARPEQLPPEAEWTTLFLRGGRGSGKTWAGAHILRELIETDPIREVEGPGAWAIIAPTFADARDKCIEGESGLLAAFDTTLGEVEAGISPTVAKWNRSIGEVALHDGTMIRIDGADDGAYRVQGENLRGAWCDEIGLWKKWKTAWDESLGYALRKGQARTIATGTPKRDRPARALVQRLVSDPKVVSRQLHTRDNWHNLSEAFKERVLRTAGTELGRQELHGELLEEAEGALWTREWIERGRVNRSPAKGYRVKVLGLDPSDGLEDGAEQAWCLAGLGMDQHLYVADSEGMRARPLPWLKAAILLAVDEQATLVIEKNHGGQFLVDLLEQAMKELGVRAPYITISASQGKMTRAEPVAMLYEQGATNGKPVVHHIKEMPELEDQMCVARGTLIATERGGVLVERVAVGDQVLTRAGPRRVEWAGRTGWRETVRFVTDCGELLLTPDHPVYVEGRGFVPASQSDPQDRIPLCPSRSVSIAEPGSLTTVRSAAAPALNASVGVGALRMRGSFETVGSFAAWPTTVTTTATSNRAGQEDDSFSTGRSGKRSAGRFRRAGMSTIETATGETTAWRTWWRSALRRMFASMSRAGSGRGALNSGARRAARRGSGGSLASSPAPNAAGRSTRRACGLPTARRSAATERWAVVERLELGPVVPVYNLRVADQPEFFANGLLVHNCNFTGEAGQDSPDRLDALVWAVTRLMTYSRTPKGFDSDQAVPYSEKAKPDGAVAWR